MITSTPQPYEAYYAPPLGEVGRGRVEAREVFLHSFRNLDAEKCHAVLDGLCHVLGDEQAELRLLVGVSIEDAEVVVELVECLGQFVAVVGNA